MQQSNLYDGFDRLTAQTTPSATTSYTYDSLNRLASQTTPGATTTSFAYLGLSPALVTESQNATLTKGYTYTPADQRLSQTQYGTGKPRPPATTPTTPTPTPRPSPAPTATPPQPTYTAYGQPIPSMFTGADQNNVNPGPTVQPYNAYRFNAMRWDSSSGQYDMGFRTYDTGLNQFLSRGMYDGALANMNLSASPFTGAPYAYGQGNPITNIELDGHTHCDAGYCPTQQQTSTVNQREEQQIPDLHRRLIHLAPRPVMADCQRRTRQMGSEHRQMVRVRPRHIAIETVGPRRTNSFEPIGGSARTAHSSQPGPTSDIGGPHTTSSGHSLARQG